MILSAAMPDLAPKERRLILQSRKSSGVVSSAINSRVLADIQAIVQGTILIRRRGRPRLITEPDPESAKGWAVGQRVYASRSRHGWTQQELADRSSIARANIARIEAGRHVPQVETLRRIADALKVSLASLLEEPARPDDADTTALAEAGLDEWAGELERLEKEGPR